MNPEDILKALQKGEPLYEYEGKYYIGNSSNRIPDAIIELLVKKGQIVRCVTYHITSEGRKFLDPTPDWVYRINSLKIPYLGD